MPASIEGAGVPLAVEERGEGRPLLLIHDVASDEADVASLAEALADRARVLTYDRRGYGGSGAPVPYEATTVHEQAEDAACVLAQLAGEPALVAGLGFGALIALDLASRHAERVGGLVLADPPLHAFVAEAAEALSEERRLLEESLREGGPELAVERWLGSGADAGRVARARTAHRAFFADLAGVTSWPVTRGTLRSLTGPAAIVISPEAPAHVRAAAEALATLLPQAARSDDGDVLAAARALL
ncbi:MAG: alpha/beta fold hydrolase [Solirubrobacteraceae bacterium]